jgi:hypothetical protein
MTSPDFLPSHFTFSCLYYDLKGAMTKASGGRILCVQWVED